VNLFSGGPVTLKDAGEQDLGFVLGAERVAREGGFVGGWSEAEHRSALQAADVAYWTVLAEPDARPVGYVILRGLADKNDSLELKRVVVSETGRGYGRHALQLVKRLAFRRLGAHRLWLDVFEHNARARHLYTSEGFVLEGTLRECVKLPGGYASLHVMSLLAREYTAREYLARERRG